MKRTTLLLFITTLLVLIGLTACERPAPGSEAPPATATSGVPGPNATLSSPLSASPTTVLVATLDPNALLVASPTPATDAGAQPGGESTAAPVGVEPTAAPTPVTSSTGEIIHIVQAGENLYRIGLRYGFTYQELAAYNGITNPDSLSVGQQIRIPPKP